MDKAVIYTQILSLKATKKGTTRDSCALELIRITGYVNIIDMLLLPLYYTWEHLKYGTLEEVNFETYLVKAYTRYSLSTKKYKDQIVLILRKTSTQKDLSQETKSIVMSLLETYSDLN
jgi:hypothetical protein